MDNLETREERLVMRRTCFSIEPGIYREDFGVRSEVNVFIDGDGQVHVTGGPGRRRSSRSWPDDVLGSRHSAVDGSSGQLVSCQLSDDRECPHEPRGRSDGDDLPRVLHEQHRDKPDRPRVHRPELHPARADQCKPHEAKSTRLALTMRQCCQRPGRGNERGRRTRGVAETVSKSRLSVTYTTGDAWVTTAPGSCTPSVHPACPGNDHDFMAGREPAGCLPFRSVVEPSVTARSIAH